MSGEAKREEPLVFRDIDGNEVQLEVLVRREPDWAANRIRVMTRELLKPSTPAAKAGDGWIRCSERLPEPERNVLLYYAVNGVLLRAETVVARNCVRQDGSRYWYSPAFPLHDGDEIAWQPLPAPPKPTEGGGGGA